MSELHLLSPAGFRLRGSASFPMLTFGLILVLFLVLAAEFVNGATDAPNAIATVVSTRVLSPRKAVLMATLLNAVGVVSGTAVAKTLYTDIIRPDVVNLTTIGAAMVAIVVWSSLAWRFGLPTSETHALGATGRRRLRHRRHPGPRRVGLEEGRDRAGLLDLLGFFGGLAIVLTSTVFRTFRVGKVQAIFAGSRYCRRVSWSSVTAATTARSSWCSPSPGRVRRPAHARQVLRARWVLVICSVTMAIGTSVGGWRIHPHARIKMVKLEPFQGFAAETGAAPPSRSRRGWASPSSPPHTITPPSWRRRRAQRLRRALGRRREVRGRVDPHLPGLRVHRWFVTTVVHWIKRVSPRAPPPPSRPSRITLFPRRLPPLRFNALVISFAGLSPSAHGNASISPAGRASAILQSVRLCSFGSSQRWYRPAR